MTNKEYITMMAYKEGSQACRDGVDVMHNPYVGVSHDLTGFWEQGWYDMFYSE